MSSCQPQLRFTSLPSSRPFLPRADGLCDCLRAPGCAMPDPTACHDIQTCYANQDQLRSCCPQQRTGNAVNCGSGQGKQCPYLFTQLPSRSVRHLCLAAHLTCRPGNCNVHMQPAVTDCRHGSACPAQSARLHACAEELQCSMLSLNPPSGAYHLHTPLWHEQVDLPGPSSSGPAASGTTDGIQSTTATAPTQGGSSGGGTGGSNSGGTGGSTGGAGSSRPGISTTPPSGSGSSGGRTSGSGQAVGGSGPAIGGTSG